VFPLLVALIVIGLFTYQFFGEAAIRWQNRWSSLKPIARYIGDDIKAIIETVTFRERNKREDEVAKAMGDLDEELGKL
jgi:uncharacterized membrane protein